MSAKTKRRRAAAPALPQLEIFIPPATQELQVQYVPWQLIHPDPEQPRQEADAELRASVAQNGILQPLTLRRLPGEHSQFLIVDGERRWRAAEGVLETVPCLVRDDLDDRAFRLRTQVVANTGKPLEPLEEARAFATMMESAESIAALARELGRPERTIAERLSLLDLGPWLPILEAGRIPVSYAAKVLLPLRGCPDDVHARAVGWLDKDWRATRNADAGRVAMSLHDFAALMRQAYAPAMYPLLKTKSTWHKQPAFDTKAHDRECDCGRIPFELDGSGKRACCGNPGWWRPKHRAAQKAKPKKNARGAAGARETIRFHLPPEASTVKASGYSSDPPKGITALTDARAWATDHQNGDGFDPSAIAVAPDKLVLVQRSYGDPIVGTRDEAAVKAAREAWATRWADRRRGLVRALAVALKEKGRGYRVEGPGVVELLARIDSEHRGVDGWTMLIDVAAAHDHPIPKDLWVQSGWSAGDFDAKAFIKWLGGFSEPELAALATGVAYLCATRTPAPSAKVAEEIAAEKKRIARKPLPWLEGAQATKNGKRPAAAEDDDDDE